MGLPANPARDPVSLPRTPRGEDGVVKTRTLIILAVLTAALILVAGLTQIVLGRYVLK